MKEMNSVYVALILLVIQPALIHAAAQGPLGFKAWIAQQDDYIQRCRKSSS